MVRKMVVGAVVVMAVAAMAAQPAEAGVGGCRIGVGGCKLDAQIAINNGSVVLDALKGAVRADFLAYMKSLTDSGKSISRGADVLQGGTQTSDGVGGCRLLPGVGGCKL